MRLLSPPSSPATGRRLSSLLRRFRKPKWVWACFVAFAFDRMTTQSIDPHRWQGRITATHVCCAERWSDAPSFQPTHATDPSQPSHNTHASAIAHCPPASHIPYHRRHHGRNQGGDGAEEEGAGGQAGQRRGYVYMCVCAYVGGLVGLLSGSMPWIKPSAHPVYRLNSTRTTHTQGRPPAAPSISGAGICSGRRRRRVRRRRCVAVWRVGLKGSYVYLHRLYVYPVGICALTHMWDAQTHRSGWTGSGRSGTESARRRCV